MVMNEKEHVDIPEGMDPADARVAIKLLYGADQTYRSALYDFSSYEQPQNTTTTCSSVNGKNVCCHRIATRKRLRQNETQCNNIETRRTTCTEISKSKSKHRTGRITKLHVTGLASIFLPSWDLSFEDLIQLDHLVCLKLNGCDSVPSEIFFDLPCLEHLSLVNCQELKDPCVCIQNQCTCKRSSIEKLDISTVEELDIRGGGLWNEEFLTALRWIFPYLNLKSLRLSHTPYASCYNSLTKYTAVHATTERRRQEQLVQDILRKQQVFHESMGQLLLEALSSLGSKANGSSHFSLPNSHSSQSPPPLEYLQLSFFNSLLDQDVALLLLDVVPRFPNLHTLDLPHHALVNLQMTSQTISKHQSEYESLHKVLPPHWIRSSVSRSIASSSRLRRLWLKPSVKQPRNEGSANSSNSSSNNNANNNANNNNANNGVEKKVLISLLTHFPELSCVARSSNYKSYLYSPCPCCQEHLATTKSTTRTNSSSSLQQQEQQIHRLEYLLRFNHSGRCLLEGNDNHHQLVSSAWPLVLERAWKAHPPDFCPSLDASAACSSVVYRLLRDGGILF